GALLSLNNQLNALLLSLRLVRSAKSEAERARHLEAIEAAATAAAALGTRLQGMNATLAPRTRPRALALNEMVMEALHLVRPDLTSAAGDKSLHVDARLGELPPILAAPPELRALLCALVIEARDTLSTGGLLTIRTELADGRAVAELSYPVPPD